MPKFLMTLFLVIDQVFRIFTSFSQIFRIFYWYPFKMSRTKCRGENVAIIMSRTKISRPNNIAWPKCRAHNVAEYKAIKFLRTSKSCDIKQFRKLCLNNL